MAILLKKPISVTLFLSNKQHIRQGKFLSKCGRLLSDGFSLKEALTFLTTMMDKESREMIGSIQKEVSHGIPFSQALKTAGFPDYICAQIYFSLYHGYFPETTLQAGEQLLKQSARKKKLLALIHYPFILLLFVTLMLFAMRYILIPHIDQLTGGTSMRLSPGTQLIVSGVYHAPVLLVAGGGICLLGFTGLTMLLQKQSPLKRLTLIIRWTPSSLFNLFWSQFFSQEWGYLLKGKHSLREVVSIMKSNTDSPLINEVGDHIESEMKKGHAFHEALGSLGFLQPEVIEVVKHGEISGKLGSELEMYARSCEEEFDQKVEQLMEWIQPIVFIFVAVIIIAVYAALLLPTFSLMNTL